MVSKYVYGKPFETLAVVEAVEEGKGKLPYFTEEEAFEDGALSINFSTELADDEIVYGLGETMRGINKRGGRYVMFNTDNPTHRDEMDSLYGAHSFLVVDGKRHFGVFFDTPSRVVFDVDKDQSGRLEVYCETRDLIVYLIEGESSYDITRQFLFIIGQSYIPPLWAFGYGQSRWGYKTEKEIKGVAARYEEYGIPLDYICMDIDYMDRFIDFTVNKRRFPDLKRCTDDLKKKGVRVVPIIDAGVKVEPGNPTYDEGIQKDYFCKDAKGEFFKAAVWPGYTHFPDFCKPEARLWFGRQFEKLTSRGVPGFWIDMNEPAIFWMEGHHAGVDDFVPKQIPSDLTEPSRKAEEYMSFYQDYDGRHMRHYDIHNVFGHFMAVGAGTALGELMDERYMLFSRSSYIGTHRYSGVWTGDNQSSWEMLRRNLTMMPGLNMCGLLFSGADTGGFGGHAERELLLRWTALSAFTPLYRNHSSRGSVRQEPYRFKPVAPFRDIISLRYRLLPYIYSEYVKAALRRDMYFKPLGFLYSEDEEARRVEDQLLVGESIMIAPVMEQGALSRSVYLPDDMTEVRYNGRTFETRRVSKGRYEVGVALNEVVFWILPGRLVPVGPFCRTTDDMDLSDVTLLGDGSEYEQYLDDGFTKEVSWENVRTLKR